MLTVKNITVNYNNSPAINDVTFSISKGERVALIGANGAGKSTLLLALNGILDTRSGEICVDGITLSKKTLAQTRSRTGMIFQNPDDQLFMPTILDDIAFGPRNNKKSGPATLDAADRLLELLGIPHLKHRFSHQLSGGEKRLAALAGVLIMEPELLLMDEPTSFLDPRARRRLMEILAGLHETMLIATHDLDMALALCGRVILLKDGRIERDDAADLILRDEAMLFDCGLELPLCLQDGPGYGKAKHSS